MSKLKRWQTQAEIAAHRRAQSKYEKSPEEIKKREARNLARDHAEKDGKVHKGDQKDVDHKNSDATDDNPKNLRVISRHRNRSYARDSRAHKLYPHKPV